MGRFILEHLGTFENFGFFFETVVSHVEVTMSPGNDSVMITYRWKWCAQLSDKKQTKACVDTIVRASILLFFLKKLGFDKVDPKIKFTVTVFHISRS